MPVEIAAPRQTQSQTLPLSPPPTSPLLGRSSSPGRAPRHKLYTDAIPYCLSCGPASKSAPSPHSPPYILHIVFVARAGPRAQLGQPGIPKLDRIRQSKMRTPDAARPLRVLPQIDSPSLS